MLRRIRNLIAAGIIAATPLATVLIPGVAHAVTDVCTWTGTASANFNDTGNWSGCDGTLPQNGDSLIFDITALTSSKTLTNDMTSLSVADISVIGTNASYVSYDIDGNSLTVTGTITGKAGSGLYLNNPIVLGANVTVSAPDTGSVSFDGVVSGAGGITKTGVGGTSLSGANTFAGATTVNAGSIYSDGNQAFGASGNVVTINDGADVSFNPTGCTGELTVPYALTLNGASSQPSGQYPAAKLTVGGPCSGASSDEQYGGVVNANESATFSGAITLGSDVTFGAGAKTTTLTGALSGAHKFVLTNTYGGQLQIQSSSNTSSMSNGIYTATVVTQTLSDDQATKTVAVYGNAVVTIDGKRGGVFVGSGGKLMGSGKVDSLNVGTNGIVAPGHSPGCLTVDNSQGSNEGMKLYGTYEAEIGGTVACTGYDQIKVTGPVKLLDSAATPARQATLTAPLYGGFVPAVGQSFTIIDNDGSDAVEGTFKDIAEGGNYTKDGVTYKVSYKGGDGNDVVLTVQAIDASALPKAPKTGFALTAAHPAATLLTTLAVASGLLIAARASRKISTRR